MPVRIRIPTTFWTRPPGRTLLLVFLGLFLAAAGTFAYIWHHFSGVIDARLSGQVFDYASAIYAAPDLIALGDDLTRDDMVAQLRRFGYSGPDDTPSTFGRYHLTRTGLEIRPGSSSLVGSHEAVRLEWAEGRLARATSLLDHSPRQTFWLDPAQITNIFDSHRRAKRRLVRYEELPPHLIQAVLAAEDRRFFDHPGVSVRDIVRALWVDIREGAPVQGASTLTMQLARSFFLDPSRTLKRKASEAVIALQLERRFSKEKIFELYANEIYLGQRGSFSIHGFGEAARAYFDKDITQLNLPESALLAGLIRGPSRYNPYRQPERALQRRNYILQAMVETDALTAAEAEAVAKAPLQLAPANVEASEAPYFIDLVRDRLLDRFSEEDLISRSYRLYTTLDPRLQEAAAAAVREALPEVDAKIRERYRRSKEPVPQVQVALIALDPHTGAVRALVGGRDYTRSQLNRTVAPRQPGSAFKPFVYAAAFGTALDDPEHALTPVTTVVDEPTVFEFEGQRYEPSNFGEKFFGVVTLREALVHSLNVATVKAAQLTGYDSVAQVALSAGLNPRLRPTPAIALGAYDSTPLEVAGAYTVFANGGSRLEPYLVSAVLSSDGRELWHTVPQPSPVLDPRVAFMVLDVLQDALNRGTGVGARSRGFVAPAAGKTGTSRDGWFVGFTSGLLCAVWVGFDDGRDLGLPGSTAALPIWTAFMKQAVLLPTYRDTEEFIPPEGIVSIPIDPDTLLVATSECPQVRYERFILGSEPRELCPKHRPSVFRPVTRTLLKIFGLGRDKKDSPQPAKSPGPD
ncbi:MAG: PBP1A family penicillin-binding protein [Acidobacteria bacterium]|nr:PBP1A family penicillin-binding protein [Acidobacteriota bacterium]